VLSVGRTMTRCRQSVRRLMSPLASASIGFVYPPSCPLCSREVEGARFCDECRDCLKPDITGECPRCGAPVGKFANLDGGCGQCRRESYAFDRVLRLGVYSDEMRLACLRAKSAGGSSLARSLARTLVQEKRSIFEECTIDHALPVPEHWTRRLLHPHYAAETLSREMAEQLGIRWDRRTLLKVRRTRKQATSPTAQRRQQQQGSFAVRRGAELKGKTVLLVDDVLTTGSTASAAARTLKQAGAKRVIVAVIAVSPLRQ